MSAPTQSVYIGLGSNLNNPTKQLKNAVNALRKLPNSHYVKDSGLFLSKAMQLPDDSSVQPDYYNAVVLVETQLDPFVLLKHLQEIEKKQGRVKSKRWSSRTLDLDILLYGDMQINTDTLIIPHPGVCEREFVLYPLQRIEETLTIPGHGKLADNIENCSRNNLEYLGSIE